MSSDRALTEAHDEWCDRNGCRCGKCPCAEFPGCRTSPAEEPRDDIQKEWKKAVADE